MKTIKLEINDCSECPFHSASTYPTDDTFERPSYWWCNHPDMKQKEKNEAGGYAKKIAGYVEWNDKTPIPDWCPIVDHPSLHGYPKGEPIKEEPDNYITRVPIVSSSFFATDDDEGEVEFLNKIASRSTSKDLDQDGDLDHLKNSIDV